MPAGPTPGATTAGVILLAARYVNDHIAVTQYNMESIDDCFFSGAVQLLQAHYASLEDSQRVPVSPGPVQSQVPSCFQAVVPCKRPSC